MEKEVDEAIDEEENSSERLLRDALSDGSHEKLVEAFESLDESQRRLAAEKLREVGNLATSRHQWKEALERYNESLLGFPDSYRTLCNRSLVLCKLERYEDAVLDASRVVQLQPAFAKGWYRMGTALTGARMHADAAKAFSRARAFAPRNEEIRLALQQAERTAKAERETLKMYETMEEPEYVDPTYIRPAVAAAFSSASSSSSTNALGANSSSSSVFQVGPTAAPTSFKPSWRLNDYGSKNDWFKSSQRAQGIRQLLSLNGSIEAPRIAAQQLCGRRSTQQAAACSLALRNAIDDQQSGDSRVLIIGGSFAGLLGVVAERAGASAVFLSEPAGPFAARAALFLAQADLEPELFEEQEHVTVQQNSPADDNGQQQMMKVTEVLREQEELSAADPQEPSNFRASPGEHPDERQRSVITVIGGVENDVLLARELGNAPCNILCLGDAAAFGPGAALFDQRLIPALRHSREELLSSGAVIIPAQLRLRAALVSTEDTDDLASLRWQFSAQTIGNWRRSGFKLASEAQTVLSLATNGPISLLPRKLSTRSVSFSPLPSSSVEKANGVIFWTDSVLVEDSDHPEHRDPPSSASFQSLDSFSIVRAEKIVLLAHVRPTSIVFALAESPCQLERHCRFPSWVFELDKDVKRVEIYRRALAAAVVQTMKNLEEQNCADRLISVFCLNSTIGQVALEAAQLDSVDFVFSLEPSESLLAIQQERLGRLKSSLSSASSASSSLSSVELSKSSPSELVMWRDVDRQANIVVLEAFDSGLLGEGAARILARIRAQGAFARTGVIVVPGRARLWARLAQWGPTSVAGVRVDPALLFLAAGTGDRGYSPLPDAADACPVRHWLSEPMMVREFDFNSFAGANAEQAVAPSSISFKATRTGTAHAVVFWFELIFGENDDDDNVISNLPDVGIEEEPGESVSNSKSGGHRHHWPASYQWIFPTLRVSDGEDLRLFVQFPGNVVAFGLQSESVASRTEAAISQLVAAETERGVAEATVAAAVESMAGRMAHAHVSPAALRAHLLMSRGKEVVNENLGKVRMLLAESEKERMRSATVATRIALKPSAFHIDTKIATQFADQFWMAK